MPNGRCCPASCVARQSRDAGQTRRSPALAAIYDGATRTEAAAIGDVTLQIVRDWVVKLNQRGPDGLVGGKAPGPRSLLENRHRAALTKAVEDGLISAMHGVVRWRVIDLCQWVRDEFGLNVSKQTVARELRALNYRKLSEATPSPTGGGRH